MRLTIEGTPQELHTKQDQLLKALVHELADNGIYLKEALEKAIPKKEPQLKYKVLRELHAQTKKGYNEQLTKMLEDIMAVLETEPVQGKRVPKTKSESLKKDAFQKSPTFFPESDFPSDSYFPGTDSLPVDYAYQNSQLYKRCEEAIVPEVNLLRFQKGEDDSGEEQDPGAEPPDPDIDEESGDPIIDPTTGLSPSEEKEEKENNPPEEGEEETEKSESFQKGRKTKRNPHGGPFVGPRGGLYSDPQLKNHWDPDKHGPVPQKIQQESDDKAHDPGDRYGDDDARSALISLGDMLYEYQATNPYEQDITGFSRNDMTRWGDVRGDVLKMKRMLQKYKRQLLSEAPASVAKKWWLVGLGDNVPDQVVTWEYHERFGSLNIKLDGWIGSKALFWKVHNYFKEQGMWKDMDSGSYVLRDPAGFDFDSFQNGLTEILPGIQFPESAPPKPLSKEERAAQEKRETEEVLKQTSGSQVDAVWEGLATGKVKNAVGMRWNEDEQTFEFRFTRGIISALFSNKRGMLPAITQWDMTTQPPSVKVFDVEIAKLALDRIKELRPDFTIATEGFEEAQAKRDKIAAKEQAPIPEVVTQLGIDPATDERFQLRPFQNEGVRFLLQNEGNAMLGDEMGTGKTLQYLAFAVASKQKCICVGPKSVRRNWVNEAALFFPEYFRGRELDSAELLKAKKALKSKLKREATPGEIAEELGLLDRNLVSINYESVEKFRPILEWLAQEQGFESMVVDESHRMKNPKAKLTKALQKLRKTVKGSVLMSGTSIKNDKTEFLTQFEMVRPGLFKTYAAQGKYGTTYMRSEIKDKTTGELWNMMRPFYLARPKDVVLKDLPPRVTTIAAVETDPEMTPDFASTPEKYVANARFMGYAEAKEQGLSDEEATFRGNEAATQAEEELDKMRESIAAGYVEGDDYDVSSGKLSPEDQLIKVIFDKSVGTYQRLRIALAQAKAPQTAKFVKEMLEGSERNVLIFSESKAAVRRLKEEFGDLAAVHTGDESQEERERVKGLFHHAKRPEDTKERILILTTPSAREGITLTAADMVVFNDLPFTAADLQQAEARAHRIGQANKVNVYWMHAEENDMDDALTKIVQRKLHMSEKSNKGRQIPENDRDWMDKDVTVKDVVKELAGELFGRGGEAPTTTTTTGSGKSKRTQTTTAPTVPENAAPPQTVPATEPPVKLQEAERGEMYAGGENVETANPAAGKTLWTTDSDVGHLEQAKIVGSKGNFDQYTIWEWEWLSGPNKGKRESSYSHSWWSPATEPPVKLQKQKVPEVAGPKRTPVPKVPEATPTQQSTVGGPEVDIEAQALRAEAAQGGPTIPETNAKAEPRLQAVPRGIQGIVRNLHAKEKQGKPARTKLTPREAKRVHDWILENGGERLPNGRVQWISPAGAIVWGYSQLTGEYAVNYTSQTTEVWEGPEPDRPAESTQSGGGGSGKGDGGLSIQAETPRGQLTLFKSNLAQALLQEMDTVWEDYSKAQISPDRGLGASVSSIWTDSGSWVGEGAQRASERLSKGGPFIGPRGGKWKDAQHTIPWEESKTKHQYGMHYRPAGFGATPKGHTGVQEHPAFRHGVIEYDRPLTADEIRSFELDPILSPQQVKERVRQTAKEFEEYAEGWREMAEEDPRSFDQTVRQALGRQGPGYGGDIETLVAAVKREFLEKSFQKSGPFIGPRGGKWKDAAHTIPWEESKAETSAKEFKVNVHPAIDQRDGHTETFRIVSQTADKVKISRHEVSDYGPTMPKESLKHFVNDLSGKVDLPLSGKKDIDAVISGKAKLLGKGDDGLAFKVGDKVVKVSTTVPYQPENPGHRTPQQAADMLKNQVETGNLLADKGIKGVQRSQFVQHGDKGFQIKPFLEIPEKFTREQLDKIQETVHAIHDAGYAIHDDIQAGVDEKGEPVMFDVGKASPKDDKPDDDIYGDVQGDMENLSRLYRDNGERFVNNRHSDGQKLWDKAMDMRLWDKPPPAGMINKWLTRAAGMLKEEAGATLSGKKLEDRIEDIDSDLEFLMQEETTEKAEGLSDPLDYDHTKPIADREERTYNAVQRELIKRGKAKPGDFDRGGALYGRSNNELINWLESLKAANGGE